MSGNGGAAQRGAPEPHPNADTGFAPPDLSQPVIADQT